MYEYLFAELKAAKSLNSEQMDFADLQKAVDYIKDMTDGVLYITPGAYSYRGNEYTIDFPIDIFADEIEGFNMEEVVKLYHSRAEQRILRTNPDLRTLE